MDRRRCSSSTAGAVIVPFVLVMICWAPVLGQDSFEPDNSAPEANAISTDGTPQAHTIQPTGDNDWVRFATEAGTLYDIATMAPETGGGVDTVIYLYGPNSSTTLVQGDDDGGPGLYSLISRYEWSPAPGEYYIRVRAYGGYQTGGYRICVTPTVLPPRPPTLSWTGGAGFEGDGVDPDVGAPDEAPFRFWVQLTDPDNNEPDYVRLIIQKDNEPFLNRRMQARRGSAPAMFGRTYVHRLREVLPPGIYRYRFRALDDDGFADGEPTQWHDGPGTLPQLLFDPGGGLEDGVRPNTGTAGETNFLWKMIYQDNNGDPPAFVRLALWRDGAFHRVMEMLTKESEPDRVLGVVYRCRRALPAGTYQYTFYAEDKDGRAVGAPAARMSGLAVTDAAPPAASLSVAAVPTPLGAEIAFTLSSAAQVEARVLNMAGRPVRTLCRALECEAGRNTLIWDAQSDRGLAVPDGLYLIEVAAVAPDGTQARSVTRVSVSR